MRNSRSNAHHTKHRGNAKRGSSVVPSRAAAESDTFGSSCPQYATGPSDDEEDAYFERIMALSDKPSLEEEDDLFLRHMDNPDPAPLDSKLEQVRVTSRSNDDTIRADDELFLQAVNDPNQDGPERAYSEKDALASPKMGPKPSIKRIYEQLKSGKLNADATIDLHAKRLDEAKLELRTQIPYRSRKGDRIVLVITGKGLRDEPMGVLRQEIPGWIKQELGKYVETLHDAPGKLGGSGAQIVLLRPWDPHGQD